MRSHRTSRRRVLRRWGMPARTNHRGERAELRAIARFFSEGVAARTHWIPGRVSAIRLADFAEAPDQMLPLPEHAAWIPAQRAGYVADYTEATTAFSMKWPQ